jgi:glyoxylase-like metal-dependent hydrolase (beta-lactamase superfamily II)
MAASHLVIDSGEVAFVDVGTSYSVPLLLAALNEKGLTPDHVKYVCLTHVHLDHAGGAGELMRHLPEATLVVHPRGVRHMIDPTKLIAGTITVYGEQKTRELFGEISPIPAERIKAVYDEECLTLGNRILRFLDTSGHAYHHCCIVDQNNRSIFSGDTFGLSYRSLDTVQGAFIFPTTAPIHFDPPACHASIDRLLSHVPKAIYLTHFGRVTELMRLAADLHEDLDRFVDIAERYEGAGDERIGLIRREIHDYLLGRLVRHGTQLNEDEIANLIALDIEFNAKGLDVWLERC